MPIEKPSPSTVVVAVTTPLDSKLLTRIRSVDDRLDVRYEPDQLPPHDAEVMFGLPSGEPSGLADAVRGGGSLRWWQATVGGAGEQIQASGLTYDELKHLVLTRAGGVHAGPLAEFAMFGLLAFAKGLPRLLADAEARRWEHYPMAQLRGRTVLLVGLGTIGVEVARLAKAFGMRVVAITRSGRSECPDVDEVRPTRFLADLLQVANGVVLTLPLTEQTAGLFDAAAIGQMHSNAVLVNVGRGGVVDEPALIQALNAGRLAGAALDVFATEPLPADSPLWSMPNVLISPHTAALSEQEDERTVDLFSDNLHRYLAGDELRSRVDPTLLY